MVKSIDLIFIKLYLGNIYIISGLVYCFEVVKMNWLEYMYVYIYLILICLKRLIVWLKNICD